MNNGDFSLIFRQILDKFVVELVEIVKHDAFIFAARVKEGSAVVLVAVELVILRSLREAENIGVFVFVGGIIENLDIFKGVKLADELCWIFGIPLAFVREELFLFATRFFAIEIVITESNESRGNLAEADEPGEETLEVGLGIDGAERIDGIASDENVVWMLFFGACKDGFEEFGRNIWGEMDIGDEEEFEAILVFRPVEFVASVIEAFH